MTPPVPRSDAPPIRVVRPATPVADGEIARLNAASPRDLAGEMHAMRTPWQRVLDVVGQALFFVPEQLCNAVAALAGLPFTLLALIPSTPLRAAANALKGLITGAVQAPLALAGGAWHFASMLLSGEWFRSPGRALALFLEPVFTAVLVAVQPLALALKGVDDAVHPPRALAADERALLERLYPKDFVAVLVIHPENSWLRALSAHGGFTLGNDVYLTEDRRQWQGHEAIHTVQYAETPGGASVFLGRYFAQIVGDLMVGKTQPAAYANTTAEREALKLFSPAG